MAILGISLALVALFAVGSLGLRRWDPGWSRYYHPWMMLAGANLLYTLAPLTNPSAWDVTAEPIVPFLVMQLVGFGGALLGAFIPYCGLEGLSRPTKVRDFRIQVAGGRFSLSLVTGLSIALMLAAIHRYEGGLSRILMQGYYSGVYLDPSETLLLSLALYGSAAAVSLIYLMYGSSPSFYVYAGTFILTMALAGHRNLLMMFLGGLLAVASLRKKRISYPMLGLLAAATFLAFMLIGLYRNFGWQGLGEFLFSLSTERGEHFRPSGQELGTAFNVFRIHNAYPEWFDLTPGTSYVWAVIGLVPKIIWTTRPSGIATLFSDRFAMPGEGLGFSTNLEALANFGLLGVFGVNVLVNWLLTWLYQRHVVERPGIFGAAFYTNLLFIAFNVNRIDTQTVIKISAIKIGLFFLAIALVRGLARSADHAIQKGRIPGRIAERIG